MGNQIRVLSESYLMNTNMTGFRWFSNIFASLCFGRNSLSIGRVNNGRRTTKANVPVSYLIGILHQCRGAIVVIKGILPLIDTRLGL